MKILHIITDLIDGGAQAVLYRLSSNDDKNSHQIISLMDNSMYEERLNNVGIPVYTLDMPQGRLTIKGILMLFRLIRSIKPDIVQTWMYHADLVGGVIARLARTKIVIWGIRGPYYKDRTSLSTKITIRTCALLSRWIPDLIISNSVYVIENLKKIGYSAVRFVHIPNGYPIHEFCPYMASANKFRTELNIDNDTVILGMVGRYDPDKDHENLFNALKILKLNQVKFICLLVGLNIEQSNEILKFQIEKYQLHDEVVLLGQRSDIPNIMRSLDIHVLSSIAESFPNVLAEAMACGTPCVSTDVGDAADIIGNTGRVVERSNPNVLAAAIQEFILEIKDTEKWNKRKMLCRKRVVDNFSLENMIDAFVSTWKSSIIGR